MAWIEVHDNLPDHYKVAALAEHLGVPEAQAVGLLVCLWAWALRYADDGVLTGKPPRAVALGAKWTGDPQALVDALRAAGWLDDDGTLHDWQVYAGRLLDRREANRARAKASRERARTVRATTAQRAVLPNPTITQPDPTGARTHTHAHVDGQGGEQEGQQPAPAASPKRPATRTETGQNADFLVALGSRLGRYAAWAANGSPAAIQAAEARVAELVTELGSVEAVVADLLKYQAPATGYVSTLLYRRDKAQAGREREARPRGGRVLTGSESGFDAWEAINGAK